MTRLIAVTFLLLTLFMAGTSAVGNGASMVVSDLALADAPDGTADDESHDPGLNAEQTDWPVPLRLALRPPLHLPHAWLTQPAPALRSAASAPTPPPPRA